jgi:hypothetical protein
METAIWVAIVATCALFITIGGLVWKLASRISSVEATATTASSRADIAGINVAANTLKVERVASELAAHREAVAKEYVSFTYMSNLENRLIDAIGKVGDRIDGLFARRSSDHT